MTVPRTLDELLRAIDRRVTLIERRLAIRGSGGSGGSGGATPLGGIIPFGGTAAPAGWLLADGTAVSRVVYSDLFAVYGTTYGAGDGSTTFNLPNLKGRVPVGFDASQTEFNAVGKTGGAKTHTHPLSSLGWAMVSMILGTGAGLFMRRITSTSWAATHGVTTVAPVANTTANTVGAELGGTTDAASTLQPYLTLNWIISLGQANPPIDPPPSDTGWVDLSSFLLSGFTSTTFFGRRIGSSVHIRGTIAGTFPVGTATTEFCGALPVEWRPTGNEWAAGFTNGQASNVVLRPVGTMGATARITTAGTTHQFALHYYIG